MIAMVAFIFFIMIVFQLKDTVCFLWPPNFPDWAVEKELQWASWREEWPRVVEFLGMPMNRLVWNPMNLPAERAAEQLSHGGARACSAVVQVGLPNLDPQVRFMSMKVLGRAGDTSVVPTIISSLSKEHDLRVVVRGAEALCRLGECEEAKRFLLDVVKSQSMENIEERSLDISWVSWEAERILAQYNLLPAAYDGIGSVRAKLDMATSHADWRTVVSLLGARISLKLPASFCTTIADIAEDRLVAAGMDGANAVMAWGLKNKDRQIRAHSMKVLCRVGGSKCIAVVISSVRGESDPIVLLSAAEGLCRLRMYRQANPLIENVLAKADEPLQYGEQTTHKLAQRLIHIFFHGNWQLR